MKIERGQIIAGQPILKVRDFFKRNEQFGVETAAYFFGLSKKAAKAICQEFVELGYCERIPAERMDPAHRKEVRHELLPPGRSLALARAVPPISREKANQIVKDFMLRVDEINNNPKYVYKVSKVLLFGSYIRPEVAQLNDVDVAVEITSKFDDPELRQKKNEDYEKAELASGRRFRDWLDQMFCPELDVKKYLKNRSRYVSLHPIDDEVLTITKTEQKFPKTPALG